MKRALSMLGAVAMLAVGFMFAAPAAHATVTCVNYPSPPLSNSGTGDNNWPRNTDPGTSPAISMAYYCGTYSVPSQDAAFNWMWQAAQSIADHGTNVPPDRLAKKLTDNHQRIYFFESLSDLNSVWGTSYSNPPGTTVLGVTLGSGDTHDPSIPVGSVGIMRNSDQQKLKRTVYHELGHAVDRINGFPSFDGGSNYSTAKANDIYDLNHLTRSQALSAYTIPTACQSLYNQAWDPTTQTGTDNWTVAQCVFSNNGVTNDMTEPHLFANIFAKRLGGSIVNTDLGNFIASHMQESELYMDDLADNGTP